MTTNPSFIEAKKAEIAEKYLSEGHTGACNAWYQINGGMPDHRYCHLLTDVDEIDTLLESFLSEIEGRKNAGFIVDLYELRRPYMRPLSLGEQQPLEEIHRYNFFSAAIAQLHEKYQVSEEAIRDEIREREHEKTLQHLRTGVTE